MTESHLSTLSTRLIFTLVAINYRIINDLYSTIVHLVLAPLCYRGDDGGVRVSCFYTILFPFFARIFRKNSFSTRAPKSAPPPWKREKYFRFEGESRERARVLAIESRKMFFHFSL